MTVRTRFAPSPTGKPHLGNIRTAFYSWLYARNKGGKFILRIEDTDQARSTSEATQIILESLTWLGLSHDEGPFYQKDRLDRYWALANQLIDEGLAYRCVCSKERLEKLREEQMANKEKPRYDGCCREKNIPHAEDISYVIRFKNDPEGEVSFEDQVLGKVSFKNSELDDLVIVRSDGFPAYNFCVVVDDMDMNITHVLRGADHLNNTPRQMNIFKALKKNPPKYAHVPLVLGNDGKLLAKRHGAMSVLEYRDQGFLPEAVLNYLVRLGWSHGDQEIFSLEEMIKLFDIKHINKAAASFDQEKMLWLNRHYIKTLDPRDIAEDLALFMQKIEIDYKDGPDLSEIVLALRERAETLVEMAEKSRIFYEDFEDYEEGAKKHLKPDLLPAIRNFKEKIELMETWNDDDIHQLIKDTAEKFELKLGKFAQPIRVISTGGTISPPINVTLRLLGKEKVIRRLERGIKHLWSDTVS